MKERIKNAFMECKNDSITTTSVIFANKLTGKISFYNGITERFENISKEIFDELLRDDFFTREQYSCQGEIRYVMRRNKKKFLVSYYETYKETYEVEADNENEAINFVEYNLLKGIWEGPSQCCDSGYAYVEELE